MKAMQRYEKISEYSRAVCDQIRWKKAHPVITEEIENHLADQRDAYMAEGMDEITATDHAIVQMGDPIAVGTQLDRTHRPKPQWGMILLTFALLFIGLFIRIFFVYDGDRPWLWPYQFIASVVIGLGLMAAAYFSDFTLIGKYPKTVYFSIWLYLLPYYHFTMVRSGLTMRILYRVISIRFVAVKYMFRGKGYPGALFYVGFFFVTALFHCLYRAYPD